MKFLLIDRISELEAGRRIVAHKALTLAEEYLADHFATFPVLPGVLMLEAIVQASAVLVQVSHNFSHGLVLLKEARNVTYRSFVSPGQVLTVESVCKEMGAEESLFAATGRCGDQDMVKANIRLRHLDLAASDPALASTDEVLRREHRARWELLNRMTA